MVSCSDDIRHMMEVATGRWAEDLFDESTTTASRQAPTASIGTNIRIRSTRLFKRNERYSHCPIALWLTLFKRPPSLFCVKTG
ncbi:unnamed protein product [Protopolystoma xenopodis]|uniref:Uncharacterized protein n=1 Tax=Protopolystoma xenopodis TaxID=117903 RepID=A0A3S5C6L3_9PLAT|nr:unnamed protein product [Protopolystoma xenopodis]